ncbi:MAG: TonB-dependent receptor [Bacteroidetes bacterium]|nr:TonB-dependent receptor [Bacteroidota bacterium]
MRQKIIILFIYCSTISFNSLSQCAIQGILIDTTHNPISFAAVGLLNAEDSSVYKGGITDDQGKYCFEKINRGVYFIKVSSVGFNTQYSNKVEYDSINPIMIPTMSLSSAGINLNEVAVTAQKKTVEFKNGNIIVNVEGTALAAGNTVYDLLSRLPGVTISDGVIAIQGKQGVRIMIDNKLQQLSGTQLLNLLKSMNASQIEKIEVLRKPPVKYAAAGTGGIINIKTKKAKLIGFSGDIFGAFSQGFYGNPSGGFNLNYKGRKVNFFSGFTANQEWLKKENSFTNYVPYNGSITTLTQIYIEKQHNHYETFNLGADWYINKNNSIGIKAAGAFGLGNDDRNATFTISDNSLGYRAMPYSFRKPNPWIYPDFNINAEHLFDTLGTTLRFSADYSPYWDIYAASFDHHFLDSNSKEILQPKIFRTSNTLLFSILSSKLDFEKQITKSLKIEAGIKAASQNISSDYTFENLNNSTGAYQFDSTYTNKFSYKENISAAYINFNKQYKKIFIQAGVRAENTSITALSKTNSIGYTRQYFNLFPMISLEYKKSDSHNFQLSANRRINRPDYNSFNPFRTVKSLLIVGEGNPYLRPEYITSVDFTYSYKSFMYHTFSYSRIDNVMMDYTTQNDSTKVRVGHPANLKKADIPSYSLFFQKDIKKWFSLNVNATVFAIFMNGYINGQPYSISTVGFNPGLFSRFILPKDFKIELNAYYQSPVLEGINHVKSRSAVDVALKKMLMNQKLSISLAFADIFFTRTYNTFSKFQDQNNVGTFRMDTRRISVSLNYTFGKLKLQQREIKSNSEEKNRASH